MPYAEWQGWCGLAALEPFGPVRDDLRAGTIAAQSARAGGIRARAGDYFDTLRPERPTSPARAGIPAGFASRCPALTPVPA
jgi:hypothetical protein